VFLKENNRVTRIEGKVMATTKERLERLINAKKQLEAQISKNGQILAAVSKVAHSSWYPVPGMRYTSFQAHAGFFALFYRSPLEIPLFL